MAALGDETPTEETASATGTGNELYRQLGPSGTPTLVADHAPGAASSDPQLIDASGPAVFALTSEDRGRELYRIDAQGQVQPLSEAVLGRLDAFFSNRVAMDGASYVMQVVDSFNTVRLLRVANGNAVEVTTLVLRSLPARRRCWARR
jgi:hypothetical protein